MNASTMAFVPKEDPEDTHSSLKIFLMTILIHTLETLNSSQNFVFVLSGVKELIQIFSKFSACFNNF